MQYQISAHDLAAVRTRNMVPTESGPYIEFTLCSTEQVGANSVTTYPRGKAGIEFLRALEEKAAEARRWLEGRYCAECREREVYGYGPSPTLCRPCAVAWDARLRPTEDSTFALRGMEMDRR